MTTTVAATIASILARSLATVNTTAGELGVGVTTEAMNFSSGNDSGPPMDYPAYPMFPPPGFCDSYRTLVAGFQAVSLWSYGALLPVLVLCGTVGNILNLVVFARHRFNSLIYVYLRWLAVSDLLTLASLWILIVRIGWGQYPHQFAANWYIAHVEPVLHNTLLVASALLVLAITAERYVGVCHPLRARALLTRSRVFAIVAAAFVIPLVLYFPLAFQQEVIVAPPNPCNAEPDVVSETLYITGLDTDLLEHPLYGKAFQWVRITITKFLPILLVLGMNARTVFVFRRQTRKRARLTNKRPSEASISATGSNGAAGSGGDGKSIEDRKKAEEARLMAMLASVAVMYVVCVTPSAIVFILHGPDTERDLQFYVFQCVANLLEFANSAANFYIYCLSSRDFRTQFVRLARSCWRGGAGALARGKTGTGASSSSGTGGGAVSQDGATKKSSVVLQSFTAV